MKDYLIELHAHTKHSDGDFSAADLLNEARQFGYDILTITDHNTMAPVSELLAVVQDDVLIVPGMEWTTFFGHMLVIGSEEVVDWRNAEIETIDEEIKKVRKHGGIAGIAHPFSLGNPICTGCHWDFHVEDYHLVSFIEVWNRIKPDENFRCDMAYEMWTDLLDQGYRIACSAGRDWHRAEKPEENTALTYIGLEELSVEAVKKSLAAGNFYISLGPLMGTYLSQNEEKYHMGDVLVEGEAELWIKAEPTQQQKMQQFSIIPKVVKVIQNQQVIQIIDVTLGQWEKVPVILTKGYIRVEFWGDCKGEANQLITISNPFYIE